MLRTDKYLNNFIFKYVNLFEHVHPNYITIVGIFFNVMIFLTKEKNILLFCLFNFLRTICDSLDGMVARKFNKCSIVGGYLDTFCDSLHILNILYFTLKDYFSIFHTIIISSILIMIIILYLFNLDALNNHDNLYHREKINRIDILPILLSQNTYISIFFINVYFFLKNKIDLDLL